MSLLELSFQEFIDAIQTADDEASFNRIATRVTRNLGFQRFAYLSLNNGAPFLISSYPKSWTNKYFALRYQQIDLVVQRASREHDVFSWGGEAVPPAGTREQRRLFDEATNFGIRSGITVPIRSGYGRTAAFTLAGDEPLALTERLAAERKDVIQLVGLYFHTHVATRLANSTKQTDGVALTQRELQCLSWVAHGKTVADIAILVGITPRTAAFHLENARRKLQANSIAQCVAEAARRGLLD
jgi:LuxR family transcriptional regulator, activator of conjugal transfer of Ti plasmids